jgi:hypothetical protein
MIPSKTLLGHGTSASTAIALAVSICAGAGCKKATGPMPLCVAETYTPDNEEVTRKQLAPEAWFGALLPDYQVATKSVTHPVRDCTGRELTSPEQDEGCLEGEFSGTSTPVEELTLEHITLASASDDRMLVWFVTETFDNGEGRGPLSIIEWTRTGIAVRAVGAIRSSASGSALRLERVGEIDVLVAEGQACDPRQPQECWPVIRLFPILGGRLGEQTILTDDGQCLSPARFDKLRSVDLESSQPGWLRHFELTTSLQFSDAGILVTESVTVSERESSQSLDAAQPYRTADETRLISVDDRGLTTYLPSLWTRILEDIAAVDREADPVPPTITPRLPPGARPQDSGGGDGEIKGGPSLPSEPGTALPDVGTPKPPSAPSRPSAPTSGTPKAPTIPGRN